jgi:hypothetical protein
MLDWLRTLAAAIVGKTGKPGRVDTATRMAMDADFRDSGESVERIRRAPAPNSRLALFAGSGSTQLYASPSTHP